MPHLSFNSNECVGGTRAALGFTVGELLVAIALISILAALLIPVAVRTRRVGMDVSCKANLAQFGTLAQAWAAGHEGYLPLDGTVDATPRPAVAGDLPKLLGDSARRRYSYTPESVTVPTTYLPPTHETPTPFLVALLLGGRSTVAVRWSEVERSLKAARLVRCPDAVNHRSSGDSNTFGDGANSLVLFVANVGYGSSWIVPSDYASNGSVLGFVWDTSLASTPLRGRLGSVRHPSNRLLVADAGSYGLTFASSVRVTASRAQPLTLEQFLISSTDTPLFAAMRHPSGGNVLFCDGSVRSIAARDSRAVVIESAE